MKKIVIFILIIASLMLCASCAKEPVDDIIGEPASTEEWDAMVNGEYDNFTGVKISRVGAYEGKLYYKMDGKQWFEEFSENGVVKRRMGVFDINGTITYCEYNFDINKWVFDSKVIEPEYPLKYMPYDKSKFSYDIKNGTYYYSIPQVERELSKKEIKEGLSKISIKFVDGVCVYLSTPYEIDDGKYVLLVAEIGEYGTTKIDPPNESDIIYDQSLLPSVTTGAKAENNETPTS